MLETGFTGNHKQPKMKSAGVIVVRVIGLEKLGGQSYDSTEDKG